MLLLDDAVPVVIPSLVVDADVLLLDVATDDDVVWCIPFADAAVEVALAVEVGTLAEADVGLFAVVAAAVLGIH